eukprot:13191222-Alexandrium_andersonii.AAC.1
MDAQGQRPWLAILLSRGHGIKAGRSRLRDWLGCGCGKVGEHARLPIAFPQNGMSEFRALPSLRYCGSLQPELALRHER